MKIVFTFVTIVVGVVGAQPNSDMFAPPPPPFGPNGAPPPFGPNGAPPPFGPNGAPPPFGPNGAPPPPPDQFEQGPPSGDPWELDILPLELLSFFNFTIQNCVG